MSTHKQVPDIRFKGFHEEWELRKLSDIADITMGQSPNGANYTDNPNDHILVQGNADMKNGVVVPRVWTTQITKTANAGDLILSVRAPVGDVGRTDYDIVIGRGVSAIKGNDFVYQTLLKLKSDGYWKSLSTGSTFESINSTDIKNASIITPTLPEQEQIGTFFKTLDKLITLQQRKLDLLKTQKQGYLQKMFPKPGMAVPELRFKGFSDDWELRKLSDIAESFEYGLNAPSTEYDGENKYLRITDIDEETRLFKTDSLTSPNTDLSKADSYRLETGDILFARTGASVGKTYIYDDKDGVVYYAGFLIRSKLKPKFDSNFVFQNTLTDRYYNFIKVTSQRSGQPGVNAQEYASFKLYIPTLSEQSKIGTFFKQLDKNISLQQQKLDLLKTQKQGFLQKMFP